MEIFITYKTVHSSENECLKKETERERERYSARGKEGCSTVNAIKDGINTTLYVPSAIVL